MAFIDFAKVVPYFQLRPDMQVADFGCGTGVWALAMSQAVQPNGKIYAIDVQRELLISLKNLLQERNVRNVELLWGNVEELGGSKLADQTMDFVLASNILFQTGGGYKLSLEIKRVLKSGGKAAVIDWADSFNNLGPASGDAVSKEDAIKSFESSGFRLEQEFPAGDHHYGLIFKKS